jgi:hypothetical protein
MLGGLGEGGRWRNAFRWNEGERRRAPTFCQAVSWKHTKRVPQNKVPSARRGRASAPFRKPPHLLHVAEGVVADGAEVEQLQPLQGGKGKGVSHGPHGKEWFCRAEEQRPFQEHGRQHPMPAARPEAAERPGTAQRPAGRGYPLGPRCPAIAPGRRASRRPRGGPAAALRSGERGLWRARAGPASARPRPVGSGGGPHSSSVRRPRRRRQPLRKDRAKAGTKASSLAGFPAQVPFSPTNLPAQPGGVCTPSPPPAVPPPPPAPAASGPATGTPRCPRAGWGPP